MPNAARLIAPLRARVWSLVGITALLTAVTLGHYLSSTESVLPHDLFRRLYYLPIVWAAFTGGLWLGIGAALVAVAAYMPHAFFMHHHLDPASTLDKAFEIVLYLVVGALSGWLVDRERRALRRAARAALERVSAEKDAARLQGLVHLTRGLAHEIRNPLGSIQGAIEILASAVPRGRPEQEMAEIGLRETARLGRVLGDFLTFARPRAPELRPLSPVAVITHTVELCRGEGEAEGIALTRGACETPAALGDRDQIIQVLVNLVRNALQASTAGGRVEVSARGERAADGEWVVFEVRDRGCGVPAEQGSAIYDPYVTGRDAGTGLGLSIATQLVQQHGGLLGHQARDGGGTLFWFRLPASRGEVERPPAPAEGEARVIEGDGDEGDAPGRAEGEER